MPYSRFPAKALGCPAERLQINLAGRVSTIAAVRIEDDSAPQTLGITHRLHARVRVLRRRFECALFPAATFSCHQGRWSLKTQSGVSIPAAHPKYGGFSIF